MLLSTSPYHRHLVLAFSSMALLACGAGVAGESTNQGATAAPTVSVVGTKPLNLPSVTMSIPTPPPPAVLEPPPTLGPPEHSVPLESGDLAAQLLGQRYQADPNGKQLFVGSIALPPGSRYLLGMVAFSGTTVDGDHAIKALEIAGRSTVVMLTRLVGQAPFGSGFSAVGLVVAVLEVELEVGEMLYTYDCEVDGNQDRSVLAVIPTEPASGNIKPTRAWRVDSRGEVIVAIDTQNVICVRSQV